MAELTAVEILLRMEAAKVSLVPMFDVMAREQRSYTETTMVLVFGREVCARRARKLRRRGAAIRFSRWTENGKCRYKWVVAPKVPTWVSA